MFNVSRCEHPDGSLLKACTTQGAYADCYCLDTNRQVALCEFVTAFYTSSAFKVERAILALAVGRRSSDRDAALLGRGETESFAVWTTETRTPDQLLLRELTGRTKSWLMVAAAEPSSEPQTRLFFGSAVMPEDRQAAGTRSTQMSAAFQSLLWFHKLYSQVLLAAASHNLPGSDH